MVADAEMAELADALGSGPSLGYTGWRFESSFRHFVIILGSCTDMQRIDRAYKRRLFLCSCNSRRIKVHRARSGNSDPGKKSTTHLQFHVPRGRMGRELFVLLT